MTSPSYLPLLNLKRGEVVESVHFGAVAVVAPDGTVFAGYGNPDVVTYTRSSAKPFQVLPFLEAGGQAVFGLTMREVALICASHSGTDEHVAVVRSIQAKTGVAESELLCGVHLPYHKPTAEAMRERGEEPTPNRNNCSGKHSGMLAYARLLGFEAGAEGPTYIDLAHPVQRNILRAVAEMAGLAPEQISLGIDGCSAPNFAMPLRNAALAYARLCDPSGLPAGRAEACRTVVQAMTSFPDMVGGPDSFDTHLMQATGGRILCKGGAEGFLGIGLPLGAIRPGSTALGIVIKVSDGDLSGRARPAVALEVLRQLGALRPEELEKLADFGPAFPVYNRRNLYVGQAQPCFTLEQAA